MERYRFNAKGVKGARQWRGLLFYEVNVTGAQCGWPRSICGVEMVYPETVGNIMIAHRDAGGQFFVVGPEGIVNINVRYWVEREVPTLPQDVLLTMPFKQVRSDDPAHGQLVWICGLALFSTRMRISTTRSRMIMSVVASMPRPPAWTASMREAS